MSETDRETEYHGASAGLEDTVEYDGATGGWGSMRKIVSVFGKESATPAAVETLPRQNKPKGFMCVSCSWAKPADHHPAEFCENGAKATLWELTSRRCTPDCFASHTLTQLRDVSDDDLEQQGRLTQPHRYDPASDKYVVCSWEDAFADIGARLKALDPRSVVFCASGRASLETSYLYALFASVRDLIAQTYPKEFHDFNARMFTPGGFYRGNSARERIWKTETGKANFSLPRSLNAAGFDDAPGRFRLITMRSNDQFKTTIYGNSDRLRGIEGSRDVVLINPADMAKAGLSAGQMVSLVSDADDGVTRKVGPLKVTPFRLPDGCIGGYDPEMNPLVPLVHHERESKTPASKAVPVRIMA